MRFRIQTDGEMFRVRWTETTIIKRRFGKYEEESEEKHPFDYINTAPMRLGLEPFELYFPTRAEAVVWVREHYGTESEIVREWRTV